ncbi:Cytochrome P450 6k1 [Eumeta japonica]|uniref:unspecific monooxygenase n=1 Tax=Eumeta variegata TaxID=151549 RepID=A0A4C1ZDS7_EUMVA|nr:Cytochrome P450 6k1 [Eumeta japonica]
MFLVLWVLGVLLLVFLTWLFLRWRRVRRFWAERGVPHTAPNPLFGSLAFLRHENPSVWMRNQMKVHPGPYFGMWCFWKPALVVQSPELARRVLVKDADVFRDRFLSSGTSDPIGSLNIFTVNDPLWTTLRRRLTSAFTAAKLRIIQPLIKVKTDDLVGRIRRDYLDGKNGDSLNLKVPKGQWKKPVRLFFVVKQAQMEPSKKVVVTVIRNSAKCESEYELTHDGYSAFLKRRCLQNIRRPDQNVVQCTVPPRQSRGTNTSKLMNL